MKKEQNTVMVRCNNKDCLNNRRGFCCANSITVTKSGHCKEQCMAKDMMRASEINIY